MLSSEETESYGAPPEDPAALVMFRVKGLVYGKTILDSKALATAVQFHRLVPKCGLFGASACTMLAFVHTFHVVAIAVYTSVGGGH